MDGEKKEEGWVCRKSVIYEYWDRATHTNEARSQLAWSLPGPVPPQAFIHHPN